MSAVGDWLRAWAPQIIDAPTRDELSDLLSKLGIDSADLDDLLGGNPFEGET